MKETSNARGLTVVVLRHPQLYNMKKLLLLLVFPLQVLAQDNTFSAFKNYPFTTELCAASKGAGIAWATDLQGKRNIYVAEGPAFTPRQLTHFTKDDGQEITSLHISDDGKWVVFVRGGDHGANWDIGLPINPLAATNPFKVQIACVPFAGGEVKYLSEGDEPVISANNTIAFIKGGQVWTVQPDSSAAARNLFTTRGTVDDLQWSADGRQLAFVSNRTGHSIIGVYTNGADALTWIGPLSAGMLLRNGAPMAASWPLHADPLPAAHQILYWQENTIHGAFMWQILPATKPACSGKPLLHCRGPYLLLTVVPTCTGQPITILSFYLTRTDGRICIQ